MEIIITEKIRERDIELEKIKLKIVCLANEKLRKMFPENYEEDSIVKIFIDISSDPMKIIATTNSGPDTEGRIGKIKLNIIKTEEIYSATPIIIIWARPLKKPLISSL